MLCWTTPRRQTHCSRMGWLKMQMTMTWAQLQRQQRVVVEAGTSEQGFLPFTKTLVYF